MSGHTPGPWIIREGDEWTHDVVTHHGELPDGSPNAWNVASINGRRDEAKANLALIAAAPDLLEALQLFVKSMRSPPTGPNMTHEFDIGKAERAIAKALTGESK